MAHSNTHFIFMEENITSYRRKISDSVRRASSLFDEKKSVLSMGLTGHQPLRTMTTWLRSRTSDIIDSLVGVKKGDVAIDYNKSTNTRWYLDEQMDWAEMEVVLGRFFPSTVDRQDRQLLELEEETRYCRDELNIVYLAVMKFNTEKYEDVFDGLEFHKKMSKEKEEKEESDPINKLAEAAIRQDIEHFEEDKIGQIYLVPSNCSEKYSNLDGPLQLSADQNSDVFVKVEFSFDLELDVTFAGENILKKTKMVNEDLEKSKDLLKTADGDNFEIIGEKMMVLVRNEQRLLTRVVFVRGSVRLQLAWFVAFKLGYFHICKDL